MLTDILPTIMVSLVCLVGFTVSIAAFFYFVEGGDAA